MEFAAPVGDPGWFGPGSAVWHVHSHMQRADLRSAVRGLHRTARPVDLLDGHAPLAAGEARPTTATAAPARSTLTGAAVRLGHSIAFFIGTAYGSTETAERLAQSVRAMHHTIKGVRPDGARYDADDPDWLRWNYATVVWGLATAHELYHPKPLRGKKLDRYYGEFVRVGHALGGTDLPTTKAETLDCLESYLPRLALTHGAAMATGPNLPVAAERGGLGDPRHDAEVGRPAGAAHQPQHRRAHRAAHRGVGGHQRAAARPPDPIPEFRQAQARVQGGTTVPHTAADARARHATRCSAASEVEHSFA